MKFKLQNWFFNLLIINQQIKSKELMTKISLIKNQNNTNIKIFYIRD